MKTTIILKENRNRVVFNQLSSTRSLYFADSESDSHLYHIEHPEVDSYIISAREYNNASLRNLVDHIRYLNSIVAIILTNASGIDETPFKTMGNITFVREDDEIADAVKNIPEVHRDANRVEWPVKIIFRNPKDAAKQYNANVLSLSSGGCFIRTDVKLTEGEPLVMTIQFKEFDFFTEGVVVRRIVSGGFQPEGLAIKFERTSPQTKSCIQNIINEKLLSELMQKLNPKEDF
jgi:Tfp pilus assembly protein PilZ